MTPRRGGARRWWWRWRGRSVAGSRDRRARSTASGRRWQRRRAEPAADLFVLQARHPAVGAVEGRARGAARPLDRRPLGPPVSAERHHAMAPIALVSAVCCLELSPGPVVAATRAARPCCHRLTRGDRSEVFAHVSPDFGVVRMSPPHPREMPGLFERTHCYPPSAGPMTHPDRRLRCPTTQTGCVLHVSGH